MCVCVCVCVCTFLCACVCLCVSVPLCVSLQYLRAYVRVTQNAFIILLLVGSLGTAVTSWERLWSMKEVRGGGGEEEEVEEEGRSRDGGRYGGMV